VPLVRSKPRHTLVRSKSLVLQLLEHEQAENHHASSLSIRRVMVLRSGFSCGMIRRGKLVPIQVGKGKGGVGTSNMAIF